MRAEKVTYAPSHTSSPPHTQVHTCSMGCMRTRLCHRLPLAPLSCAELSAQSSANVAPLPACCHVCCLPCTYATAAHKGPPCARPARRAWPMPHLPACCCTSPLCSSWRSTTSTWPPTTPHPVRPRQQPLRLPRPQGRPPLLCRTAPAAARGRRLPRPARATSACAPCPAPSC